jgi:chlorophyllide a reductase subunit Z
VLVQISAARRLRDHAERLARMSGVDQVSANHVEAAGREMGWEVTA